MPYEAIIDGRFKVSVNALLSHAQQDKSVFLFVMPSSPSRNKVAHGTILLARDIQAIFTLSCVIHGHETSHPSSHSGTPMTRKADRRPTHRWLQRLSGAHDGEPRVVNHSPRHNTVALPAKTRPISASETRHRSWTFPTSLILDPVCQLVEFLKLAHRKLSRSSSPTRITFNASSYTCCTAW
jgi:hypothetical protein